MKALFFVLLAMSAVFLFTQQGQVANLQQANSDVLLAFNSWKAEFGKLYRSVEENAYRMSIFAENLQRIYEENSKQYEYTLGLTVFADLTNEEFASHYLGFIRDNDNEEFVDDSESYEVPNAAFNWADKPGVVTPVKNQGSCGSCWAFSATGTIEGYYGINKGELPNVSEQQLVDCVGIVYGCLGCNGGQMDGALKWVKANGITTGAAYPYTARDGTCKTKTGAYHINSVKSTSSCASLTADIQTQPTSVAVDASNWSLYRSGVFSNCAKNLNHGVLATGWDGSGNWIIKNSWGTSWGVKGWITLKSGDTCGVCQEMNNAY